MDALGGFIVQVRDCLRVGADVLEKTRDAAILLVEVMALLQGSGERLDGIDV